MSQDAGRTRIGYRARIVKGHRCHALFHTGLVYLSVHLDTSCPNRASYTGAYTSRGTTGPPPNQNTSVSRRDSVTVTVVCPCTTQLRPLLLQGAGASESRAMCMLGDCAWKAGSDDVAGIGEGRDTEVLSQSLLFGQMAGGFEGCRAYVVHH